MQLLNCIYLNTIKSREGSYWCFVFALVQYFYIVSYIFNEQVSGILDLSSFFKIQLISGKIISMWLDKLAEKVSILNLMFEFCNSCVTIQTCKKLRLIVPFALQTPSFSEYAALHLQTLGSAAVVHSAWFPLPHSPPPDVHTKTRKIVKIEICL